MASTSALGKRIYENRSAVNELLTDLAKDLGSELPEGATDPVHTPQPLKTQAYLEMVAVQSKRELAMAIIINALFYEVASLRAGFDALAAEHGWDVE